MTKILQVNQEEQTILHSIDEYKIQIFIYIYAETTKTYTNKHIPVFGTGTSENANSKQYDFNLLLNCAKLSAFLILYGKPFQTEAEEYRYEKADLYRYLTWFGSTVQAFFQSGSYRKSS